MTEIQVKALLFAAAWQAIERRTLQKISAFTLARQGIYCTPLNFVVKCASDVSLPGRICMKF